MTQDLSYISFPLPEDVERLVFFGDFERARRVIALRMADPKVPDVLKKRLGFELHVIDALPLSYPWSEDAAFERISAAVRDFTREEMAALRDDGTLDWIYIGGRPFYKDDCLESLIKTRVDLNPRILDKAALDAKYDNFARLDGIIAKMKEKGHVHLRYRLRTTLTIDPEAQRPGERIRVHMTLPLKSAQCTPGEVVTEPMACVAPEDHPQRTAYFETVYQPGMAFVSEFTYDIDAPYVNPDPAAVSPEQPSFDTEEMLPQIRFTPFIRALAAELKGDETNPLVVARRFYDYVTTNTCYRYVPPYFTKACIPEYFGAGLRGDCGMHALLFIALCRCAGIPAQWQAGLYTRPGSVGNHDWARFYVAPYGWLFADGSFGGAAFREGHLDRWNFYFGNLEPWRMVANCDLQQEFDPPMQHLRADPYDNQSGEVEYDDRALGHHEFTVVREMLSCEEIED